MLSRFVKPDDAVFVVQITDTHLYADPERKIKNRLQTAKSLQAVLTEIKKLDPQPDLLLLTGDLSQDETPESYHYLQEKVAELKIPTYWLPGNHDQVNLMTEILQQPPLFAEKVIEKQAWKLILLNSVIPGDVRGEISEQTLAELEQELSKSPDQFIGIALHHPPVAIGSTWMDAVGLQNPENLLKLIQKYPQIKLVLFGHIHQEFAQVIQGVTYLGTPSTGLQFAFGTPDFAIDNQLPGFRQLILYADGTWETKVERVKI